MNIDKSSKLSVNATSTSGSLMGSDNNYSVDVNDDGDVLLVVNFPSESNMDKLMDEYNLTLVVNAYNDSEDIVETKTINVKYYVMSTSTDKCDNNQEYSIKTNGGDLIANGPGLFYHEVYTLTTNNGTLDITITPDSSKSSVYYLGSSIGDGDLLSDGRLTNQKLNYGDNAFIFSVRSECAVQDMENRQKVLGSNIIGGTDWYQNSAISPYVIGLEITRNDNRSSVNTLKSLSISDANINFKSDVKEYKVTVPYKVSSVKINSSLTDTKSSYVDNYGNRTVDLSEGNNDVLIKVRAENGDESTYTIKIDRENNDDATLKELKLNDKEIKLKDGVLSYKEYVHNDVVKASISAVSNDSNAKVEIDEIEELKEGNNKVNIKVTAKNGKELTYELNIIRDKLISENSKLKDIKVANYNLSFNSNDYDYELNINSNEKKLDIVVETEHEKAKYVISGNDNLKNGSIIEIKVTAEDGKTTSIYKIKVNKESSNILIYVIIPILVIIILAIVFLLIKGNKNNKKKDNKKVVKEVPREDDINTVNDNDDKFNFDDIPINSNINMTQDNNYNSDIGAKNDDFFNHINRGL